MMTRKKTIGHKKASALHVWDTKDSHDEAMRDIVNNKQATPNSAPFFLPPKFVAFKLPIKRTIDQNPHQKYPPTNH